MTVFLYISLSIFVLFVSVSKTNLTQSFSVHQYIGRKPGAFVRFSLSLYLSASMPLCLSVFLPLCLSASLPLCLSASLPPCPPAPLPLCLSVSLSIFMFFKPNLTFQSSPIYQTRTRSSCGAKTTRH
jgi:hypothetical protein